MTLTAMFLFGKKLGNTGTAKVRNIQLLHMVQVLPQLKNSHPLINRPIYIRLAVLLLDVCQGHVVGKQHTGQVEGRAEALYQ